MSSQRTSASASIGDFRIALTGEPLDGKYKLAELFICNAAYNVTATSNVVYWTENGTDVYVTTVPVGIYSAYSLATAVATAMTDTTISGGTFTGTYNDATKKIYFTCDIVVPVLFTFDVNTTNSIGSLIGYVGGEDGSTGGTNVVNVNPLLSFNFQINGTTEIVDSKSSGFTFVVAASADSGSYIHYYPPSTYVQIATISRAQNIHIRVVDDSSNTIPLLYDFFMVLERVC